MKLRLFLLTISCLFSVWSFADSNSEILKQRRKGTHCGAYHQVAQHKSQLELQLPPIKLNAERDTQLVKPSEETLRLGMQMKAVCEAFISDPTMTTEQYLNRIQALEDAQRQIEKRVIVVISQELPSVQDKVTATTIPEKK